MRFQSILITCLILTLRSDWSFATPQNPPVECKTFYKHKVLQYSETAPVRPLGVAALVFSQAEIMSWEDFQNYTPLFSHEDSKVKSMLINALFRSKVQYEKYEPVLKSMLKDKSITIREEIIKRMISEEKAQIEFEQIQSFLNSDSIYQKYLAFSALSIKNKVRNAKGLDSIIQKSIDFYRSLLKNGGVQEKLTASIYLSALKDQSSFNSILELVNNQNKIDTKKFENVDFNFSSINYPEPLSSVGYVCADSCNRMEITTSYLISLALMNLDFERSVSFVVEQYKNKFEKHHKDTVLKWVFSKAQKKNPVLNEFDDIFALEQDSSLKINILILLYELKRKKLIDWEHKNHKYLTKIINLPTDIMKPKYSYYLIVGKYAWDDLKSLMYEKYAKEDNLGKIGIMYGVIENKDENFADYIIDETLDVDNVSLRSSFNRVYCESQKW